MWRMAAAARSPPSARPPSLAAGPCPGASCARGAGASSWRRPRLAAARSRQECSELVRAHLSREHSRRARLARCRPECKRRDFPVLEETSGRAGGQHEQRRHHLPPKGPFSSIKMHLPPGPTQPAFLYSSPPARSCFFPAPSPSPCHQPHLPSQPGHTQPCH